MNSEYHLIPSFTYTDSHVVSGSEDGQIYQWELVEGTLVNKFLAHTRPVTSIVYHPSLHCMLSASFDGTAKIWT
jgi:mitogen-activated protein kinase organizer 1